MRIPTLCLPGLVSSKFFFSGRDDQFLYEENYTDSGNSDDGSGTVAVLRVAEALSKFQTKNAVRFAFWGAEEFGKLGSYYYVKQLNSSESEISKLRAYLNFDMVCHVLYSSLTSVSCK